MVGSYSLPVGSAGTAKHAFSPLVRSKNCAYQEEPGGHYCALPENDSVHEGVTAPTIQDKLGQFASIFQPAKIQSISFPDHPTVQEVRAYFEECTQIVKAKNPKYGEAWKRQGYMGNLARVMSKAARLESMLWKDVIDGAPVPEEELSGESIEDTLRDLANLTAFMMLNYTEGNRWGS